jgi:hypothetical protein
MNCEEGEWRRRYWGSIVMFRKLCWGTSGFSVCASVRPSVRSFVRSSVTLQVYPCVEAIILWRCGHITMKLGTQVRHDVKCKLWKNKMTVTYVSRLDELGNFWRFASDLPLCWSYSSMKMRSYHRETWYTCTSWYTILDLQARLWFWPKSAERDISVVETHVLVSKFSINMLWCERVRRKSNQSVVNLCKCTCTAHIIWANLNFIGDYHTTIARFSPSNVCFKRVYRKTQLYNVHLKRATVVWTSHDCLPICTFCCLLLKCIGICVEMP